MFERKRILLGTFAILVGIATIFPLGLLMSSHVAQATVVPWFNVEIFYAYCNPDQNGGNSSVSFYGSYIQAVVNITLTPYAMKDADAQIEYYQFSVSSDQGPIVNMSYYVVQSTQAAITSISGNGAISFANGLNYSGPTCNGGEVINRDVPNNNFTLASVNDYISTIDPNDVPKAVTELRNAQTLYMDVSKVCTVTVNGNVTITTPASPEVLQHVTLTKTKGIFEYGTQT
jgi:hypothetical protein